MLQQTRVQAVIPFYERWLKRFPSVRALADAEPDAVLLAWEGLGYYSRARNLHRAARLVRDRHDDSLPTDLDALRALPGVGDYTAGAIASIAFGQAQPAVDGNVRRVLARIFDEAHPDAVATRARAAVLVDPDRPGDFNQALMELGATVCVPRSPECGDCPVMQWCGAHANGTERARPARRARSPVPRFDVGTALVHDDEGRLLLTRNGPGLLAGLWSFPGEIARGRGRRSAAARRAALAVLPGAQLSRARSMGTVGHAFTHRHETYHAYAFGLLGDSPPLDPDGAIWVAREGLGDYALPVAQRRIAELADR
jgi:A/G-specific adenine glycosylase